MVHSVYGVHDFTKDMRTFFKLMLYSSFPKPKDMTLI